ncbi:HD domain-containing protein [Clostridium omnivorum]|uniref:Phosphohydrolase n=1 Tax=Clostridium omnivorum TaxID=1604902 RepID=A0ABQ5N6S7_9CLOT|nr:HD domain-containing protein [Clostridium sp. E14]GLC30923.1 phosphohydrolase [Clostridium sp. E14]
MQIDGREYEDVKGIVINNTIEYVKAKLEGEGSGHDWWHVYRVWKNSILISENEKVDMYIVELAALLHDIGDWKFYNGDETVGPRLAREWLNKNGVDESIVQQVSNIIGKMSYKGKGVKSEMDTIEGMVVQDADRLDAIGAIGIARAFAYGGSKGREMYNPNRKPEYHETFEQYKSSTGTTINHFYEKLLLLKDLMNTNTAKKIAAERHEFMENFLEQFYGEWSGR